MATALERDRTVSAILDARAAGDAPECGGKARALALAAEHGIEIPVWFVVRGRAVDTSSSDPAVMQELARALDRLCPAGELVAVRSSAVDEDGPERSYAGQLESVLNVPPARVWPALRAVHESGRSDRLLAYRRARGLAAPPAPPSVLVQRMVRARCAGVAFSADPVSGRRGIAVVSAVNGLGSGLVSGECDADTWHVDRAGAIVFRSIAVKRRMHVADPGAKGGVRSVGAPIERVEQPALSDAEVIAVARLARRCSAVFGTPQDIEWAFEGERLVLLQTRPITSLSSLPDPDAPAIIWDNSNIVESYSGVTTPLTFSFASEVYADVYRQFCRVMRVPEHIVSAQDDAFRNMLGLVRGRLYYNLLNWYRILALLPGFSLNRAFMEQMMGVKQALPREIADAIARGNRRGRVVDAMHLLRTLGGLIVSHFTLERRTAAFRQRLQAALAPAEPPLADCRIDELAEHYADLRRRLLLSWDAPLVNDFLAMIFYGVLRRLATAWCGDREGTLQNDLVAGDGGLVSAEPAARIQELARIAARRPALTNALTASSLRDAREAVVAEPEFHVALESYLEKFGDRTVNELKLESITLHDDPLPLFRGIGALAGRLMHETQTDATSAPAGRRLRDAAARTVDASLAGRPLRRLVFTWVLRNARARVRDRENLRLDRTRLFARVRRIFVEIGRRLHAQGLLNDPRDVFYLEVDEILGFVEGRAATTNLRGLVALRRDEFDGYASQPAPASRFETRGGVCLGPEIGGVNQPADRSGDVRQGLGCSPGRVTGAVRVVVDPRLVDLRERAILVAAHTDPGWIMAFPSALAVVVERGSLLSHAAIVARELGIPAVVSVEGITEWLRDGDVVEVDGAAGTIRIVRRAEDPRAE